MQAITCPLDGLLLIEVKLHKDSRGFFIERYHTEKFEELGLPARFAQVNHSHSIPGVVRGLHYQNSPAQGKLVSVLRGRIWDVAVDIRKHSPTFGHYYGVELSEQNGLMFWIPPGFAHGFCVLGDESADMLYQLTEPYNPDGEGGIRFDDTRLAIRWPLQNPITSARDMQLMTLDEYEQAPAFLD